MIMTGTELLNWGAPLDRVRVFYYEHDYPYGVDTEFSRNIWIVSPGSDAQGA